jgi:Ras-related protein Rab-11A
MDCIYKIILIGNISVGKTNLLTRFITNEFSHNLNSTIGVDFATKKIIIHNKIIDAQIWDCAGQERYKSIVRFYFRGAHGIILVYDISKRESFHAIKQWLSEIRELSSMTNIILLIGNKSDLKHQREVSTEDGSNFAQKNKLLFIETSALNGSYVNDAFIHIISEIHTTLHNHISPSSSMIIGNKSYENINNTSYENINNTSYEDENIKCKC